MQQFKQKCAVREWVETALKSHMHTHKHAHTRVYRGVYEAILLEMSIDTLEKLCNIRHHPKSIAVNGFLFFSIGVSGFTIGVHDMHIKLETYYFTYYQKHLALPSFQLTFQRGD